MVDDFTDPCNPNQDKHSFSVPVASPVLQKTESRREHDFTELIEDQGCGSKLSSSRFGLFGCNIVGWVLASCLTWAGIKWNMSWVGTPISAIIGTLVTADAGAYFASRWGGNRCHGEERD